MNRSSVDDSSQVVVSIVVPIFNCESTLNQCLRSIEGQTLADIEIICVNDGSTDSSLSIIEEHAATDPRIRVINKPNSGYGDACNKGIQSATGKWLSIVEPDDYIAHDMYKKMVGFANELMAKGFEVDIVKTPYWRIIWPDSENPSKRKCHYAGRIKTSTRPFTIDEQPMLLKYHPSIWSAIYRMDFIRENDISFKQIPGSGWADNPFMAATLLNANNIAYLDEPFYFYRETPADKEAAYLRANPLVPIERWIDVMDEAAKSETSDAGVLEALYIRAFNNLARIDRACALDANSTQQVSEILYSLMDSDIVFESKEISPTLKSRLADYLGIEEYRARPVAYIANSVMERAMGLKNIGLVDAYRMLQQR